MDMPGDRFYDEDTTTQAQASFGWGLEDIGMQIADMAGSGKETTYSMGDDAPIACLSRRPHVLYNYFKQRFAQVTNPPIDPLREGVVMSLAMTLGKKESIYETTEAGARIIHLESPVLNSVEMEEIRSFAEEDNGGFEQATISTRYDISSGAEGIRQAMEDLCDTVVEEVRDGVEVIVLSNYAVDQLHTTTNSSWRR